MGLRSARIAISRRARSRSASSTTRSARSRRASFSAPRAWCAGPDVRRPCFGSRSMQLAEARHVLVTGAAGAIGGALAELLAKECPRARMTLVDKRAIPNGRGWDLSQPDALEAEDA